MEAGVNAPPFHPNCRGTTITHFDDENDIDDTRIARDEYGNPIHVDGDMTWEEWNNRYNRYTGLAAAGSMAGEVPKHDKPLLLETIDASDPNIVKSTLDKYVDEPMSVFEVSEYDSWSETLKGRLLKMGIGYRRWKRG